MSAYIAIEIVRKYLAGTSSPEETETVIKWFASHQSYPDNLAGLSPQERLVLEEKLFERIMRDIKKAESVIDASNNELSAENEITTHHETVHQLWYRRIAAAAIILLTFSSAIYFIKANKTDQTSKTAKISPVKIREDFGVLRSDKAVLTLGNGKKVNLTDVKLGSIGQQGRTAVVKTGKGQISYQSVAVNQQTDVYNLISTPKGSKYEVTLADGTRVWLNAASSLRFPTAFNESERVVSLSGEAYFEVAKDASRPFKVNVNGVAVHVLGTHFNISAYNDDSFVKTTLLEGSVKVSKSNAVKLLSPGNQAITQDGSNDIRISKANVDNAIAWRSGLFIFEHEDAAEIMKKVARWYDVEVVIKGSFQSPHRFSGRFDRTNNLTELLDYLEKLDAAHFVREGRRVTMMN